MSVARGFGLNGKSIYMNIVKPEVVWCNFIVDSANGNGWGVRSVKSNGFIESVFMHTTATPGKQNNLLNPNPQVGYAVVTFRNTFNAYLGGASGIVAPLTSTSTTSLTKGNIYVITSLGTTTTAQWQTAGLQPGITPSSSNGVGPVTAAVGMSFVAAATASLSGSGTVGVPGVLTTQAIAVVGDPNQTIANTNISANSGAQVFVQFLASTSSSVTTLIAASPADGSTISLQFCFDGSTVTIDGL